MAKYFYTCNEDKLLITKSFDKIARMIFGYMNTSQIDQFKKVFEEQVNEVNVYPQGTVSKYINYKTPGICRKDDDKVSIDMYGYNGAIGTDYSFIRHEGVHEMCHAFVDILHLVKEKYPDGLTKEGIKRINHMGMIKETDARTGKPVSNHLYGKMINETMMDIISTMANNYYGNENINDDETERRISADKILNTNFLNCNSSDTAYSFITSLTRLMIAAFSNNGYSNYGSIINSGQSIFNAKTRMKDGNIKYVNDFLYGAVFDQLHIEEEFDKYMGKDSYRQFSESLDIIFYKYINSQKIPSNLIKSVMGILASFSNRRLVTMVKCKSLTQASADQIASRFNVIWNDLQSEYNAYFSVKELDSIRKRIEEN